jgi:iron complex outermembrane receptor protein
LSSRIAADLGGATFTSITGFVRVRQHYLEDSDASPNDLVHLDSRTRANQFQQELRLSHSSDTLNWVTGLFYFNYKLAAPYDFIFPTGIPPFGVPTFGVMELTNQRKQSLAAYGNAEITLAPKVVLTVGGRVERERDRFTFVEAFEPAAVGEAVFGSPVVFTPETAGKLTRVRKTYASGNIGLNYRPADQVLTYVTFKRGIKPGGFNTPIGSLPLQFMPFKAEKLDALEGGVKADLLNRRLRFNLSGFHYWYHDYQAIQFNAPIGTFTTNAEADVTGVDWDIRGLVGAHFELGTSGTFLHGRAHDITRLTPSGVVSRDRDLPNAPRLTINGYSEFRHPLGEGEGTLRLDATYRSKTYFSIQNDPGPSQKGYVVVDGSASWRKDNLNFSLSVTNLLNRKYQSYVVDAAGFGFLLGTPGRPREIKASVGYSW